MHRLLACSSLVFSLGCTGEIVTRTPSENPLDPGPTAPTRLDCSGEQRLRVPLQRLNRRQVAQVWVDLFGASGAMPETFPATEPGSAFSTFPAANIVGDTGITGMLEASETLALALTDGLPACIGTGAAAETACARAHLTTLTRRAFRRAATAGELDLLLRVYAAARADSTFSHREGLALAVEALVLMPQALYLVEPTSNAAPLTLTGHQVAARMGVLFGLGLPDAELAAAASDGALLVPATRRTHATRLLSTDRGQRAINQFVREWLGLENFTASSTQFSAAVQAHLEEELFRLVRDALAQPDGFRALMTSKRAYVNAALEQFYGLPTEPKGPDGWRSAEVASRVGLLTHPLVMAHTAHGADPSLILRGRFVRTALLCADLPPRSEE
ncbi:MAG: DUF1592 domain-containing protein, partial [Myxococcaceae bacterium]|nr:DUF1592 domain-containing protein [Myxococcaceae bacterium]